MVSCKTEPDGQAYAPMGDSRNTNFSIRDAGVAELADAQDLKSCGTYTPVPVRFRSPALSDNQKGIQLNN